MKTNSNSLLDNFYYCRTCPVCKSKMYDGSDGKYIYNNGDYSLKKLLKISSIEDELIVDINTSRIEKHIRHVSAYDNYTYSSKISTNFCPNVPYFIHTITCTKCCCYYYKIYLEADYESSTVKSCISCEFLSLEEDNRIIELTNTYYDNKTHYSIIDSKNNLNKSKDMKQKSIPLISDNFMDIDYIRSRIIKLLPFI